MPLRPTVVLFRRDLRLSDNPALSAAAASGAPLVPLYILDDEQPFAPSGAARWWLHHSLQSLDASLAAAGAALVLRRGQTEVALHAVIAETAAGSVFWNRRYAPAEVERDSALKAALTARGIAVSTHAASLLREPWENFAPSGCPYTVFTPFWKKMRSNGPSRASGLALPPCLQGVEGIERLSLDELALRPSKPNWAAEFETIWAPGEPAAKTALARFLSTEGQGYAESRDYPAAGSTSRLSPHLAFGEISPLQIWSAVQERQRAGGISDSDAEKFLSELGWREFSYHQLFYAPDVTRRPIREEFAAFPYRHDPRQFKAWAMGKTGYPIVDAGMRELRRTGWMHNRVRMIVASFLTKHLLLPWKDGADWFWDSLVDADPASNAMGWQWVAGCGADAAPYFRIFNPTLQGEKFDPNGDYVRTFIPELRHMPDTFIHRPWDAPPELRHAKAAAISYPEPIIDHAAARSRALNAMKAMKDRHATDHH